MLDRKNRPNMEPIPTRRKLLRGSFAAPIVFTVASPSALAASSFHACIAKGADAELPDGVVMVDDAVWARREVQLWEVSVNGPPVTHFFSPLDNQFYPVDGSACATTVFSSTRELTGQKGWALVYFDNEGNEVGLGWCNPNNGVPVSTSCWTSFQGGQAA
jgi:hypothetical protein